MNSLEKCGALEDELSDEQSAEPDRHLNAFEKNPHEGIPLEQVEADLNQRFGWH